MYFGQLSYLPAHMCNSESVIKFNNNNNNNKSRQKTMIYANGHLICGCTYLLGSSCSIGPSVLHGPEIEAQARPENMI